MYSCKYRGKKELCLVKGNKYPVTKNNKLNEKRIRAANNYAARFGEINKIKKGGICKVARRKKIDLKIC